MAVIKNSSCKANACCNLPDLHFETGLFRGCFMVLEAATRWGEVNQLLSRTETLAGGSARTVFAPRSRSTLRLSDLDYHQKAIPGGVWWKYLTSTVRDQTVAFRVSPFCDDPSLQTLLLPKILLRSSLACSGLRCRAVICSSPTLEFCLFFFFFFMWESGRNKCLPFQDAFQHG